MRSNEASGSPDQHCDICGRQVTVGGAWRVATHTLCLECAVAWQMRHQSGWPPPGYVWDGTQWRYTPSPATATQPADDVGERELRWWRFLAWLVETGRVSVGVDEGADR